MAVWLSDDTWTRIEKMLEDYESGVLRVIPGTGLKFEEQVTVKSNCPGTKIGAEAANTNISGTSSLVVTDGTNTVPTVSRMEFIGTLFSVTSSNSNTTANVGLRTENCN